MLNTTAKKLYFLIIVFIIGFFSLILVNNLFTSLVKNLDKQTVNYESKLQIGRFISEDILNIKSLFFELATTTTSHRARKLVKDRISTVINRIEKSLDILEHGGVLTRQIHLNVAGHSSLIKKIKYTTDHDSLPLVVIDLKPQLIDLQDMVNKADKLLEQRYNTIRTKDTNAFKQVAKKVRRFYKTTPAFFNRMSENIGRLIYESDIELKKIKQKVEQQKKRYLYMKLTLIIFVILLVVSIGYWISTIIHKENKQLLKLNQELESKELAVKAILDGQSNIVVVSDGITMIDANEAIVKFFDQFDTIEEFKEKHTCICDFFKPYNDETYIESRDYNGFNWLEYILAYPHIDFKVLMNNGREDHHFLISANKKYIDNKGKFIIVVSLNDITSEIKSQEELAQLNNNLEHIIDEKTEELQALNNDLEARIQQELEKNREKDKQMIQQSRAAALGEMIGNIAHQWRQPLSAISSTASGVQLQLQLGLASNEDINKSYEDIKGYVSFLTQTIEDFRGFFKQDKEKTKFNIVDVVKKSVSISIAGYKDNGIDLFVHLDDKELFSYGFPNELSQVYLNILNNAKDAILENEIEEKRVYIGYIEDKNNNIIFIQDNAGGIPANIIEKIFDPYFTTKHQSQGTGIGLYMSKDIVEKNMNGKISVSNKTATLDGLEYIGACFEVSIPKTIE